MRRYGLRHRSLYALGGVILFYSIFDGLITYVTPLILTGAGFSETTMGLIIGTSSIAGLAFDFVICRVFKRADFRRIFLGLFALCALYPLLLWTSKSVWAFILAMAVWGIYYDLGNFANLNFLSGYTKRNEHASSSGVMLVFRGLGYLLAPLIAGALIGTAVGWRPFLWMWIFLGISGLFFLLLLTVTAGEKPQASLASPVEEQLRSPSLVKEVKLWGVTTVLLRPLLTLTILLALYESFFWTIGPMYAMRFSDGLGGLFLTAYELPILISGWFVGKLVRKVGKEHLGVYSFLLGSLLLATLPLLTVPAVTIAVVFAASFFFSFTIPVVNGFYADYITAAPLVEKEIEGVNDMSVNFAYIIGPMMAGFLADTFGDARAFSIIAIAGTLGGLTLIRALPRTVRVAPLAAALQGEAG